MNIAIFCCLTTTEGDWTISVHSPHGSKPYNRKHVRITKKHGLKGEYLWNVDGTRHDAHKFPKNEKYIKRAKDLAASALNIPVGSLQLLTKFEGGIKMLIHNNEEITYNRKPIFNAYIHTGRIVTILGYERGMVMIIDFME